MTRGRKSFAATLAIGAAGILAWPSPAAAVRIGSDLNPPPDPLLGYGCAADPCTVMQRLLPDDPFPQRSPINGAIRKWRFAKAVGSAPYSVRLWVVRRDPPERWSFIRHSVFRTVGAAPGTYRFPAAMRIRRGDRIAIELPPGLTDGIGVDHDGATDYGFFPAPDRGDSAIGSFSEDVERPWNATVRRRN